MLADAMEQFGRGEDTGYFRVRGAREVRGATHAFFDMRQRIKKHIEQRSQFLAGVSHDLRTPLTRLKLQLALMPPSPEIEDAKRDLAEMEETLDEYLTFAKGSGRGAGTRRSQQTRRRDRRRRRRAAARMCDRKVAIRSTPGRARALKRCLANLIDNAAAHGDRVRVSVKGEDQIDHSVRRRQRPGIPEELYEEAFRPFSRLDETRSRNQKGVGLGLAIARDVARSHGGDILVEPQPSAACARRCGCRARLEPLWIKCEYSRLRAAAGAGSAGWRFQSAPGIV
jgi:two-component system osmolarity sensor histidine kinase EnvZ